MSRTAPLRAAVVGAGLMGRWHARAAAHTGARVTAIVDPERSRAEALSAHYRGCRAFSEIGDALDGVDVVHVCTPLATHLPLATLALQSGRHVLVEKPLTETAGETAALVSLAESRGVMICPVHQFLFQDGVQAAMPAHSAIGMLRHVDVTICSAGAEGRDDSTRDRIAIEILPHPLSLLVRLLPERLESIEWSVEHPAAGEIRATARARDVTVSVLVSMAGRPTINRLQLIGSRGTTHVDLFHGFAVTEGGAVSRARKATQPLRWSAALAGAATANLLKRSWRREFAYPGLRRLVHLFYRAVAGGGSSPISTAEILAVARAFDSLRASLRET